MKNNLSNFNFGLALSDHKNKDRFTNKYYENSLDENYPIKNFNEVSVNSSNPNLSRNGHRQRMRRTYLLGGMENAPDHNLLELFLSIIIPQKDVKQLAYDLIFLLSGAFSFLNTKLKGFEKLVFIIVFASMFLCGNVNYFLFYIFIESPYMFFSICVMASLCYFSAAIIQISSGFIYGGGIFEVLLNSDKYVYLITGSIVFVAIGYFVSKYFYEKYGVSSCFNIYIPKRLRKTVSSLGGVQNIIRISNDLIEVRNPKLINEIDLKCEVKENQIKIDLNKISDLKEYLG
ncbi:MAG: hypothetical protein ACLSCS_05725 [Eubacterium sp.]